MIIKIDFVNITQKGKKKCDQPELISIFLIFMTGIRVLAVRAV